MENFQGSSFGKILIFTVIAHGALLVVGVVIPFLWGLVAGPKIEDMDEGERMELAVKAARASMSDIAKEYGLKSPDELSRKMAGGARPASKPEPATPEDPAPGGEGGAGEGEEPAGEPESEIEKEINKVEEGPAVPPVPEDDEEDLFR